MASQLATPLPVDSIYIALTPPQPITHKEAYAADVLRHKLWTPETRDLNDHRVEPGIYLHKGAIWEKIYVPETEIAHDDRRAAGQPAGKPAVAPPPPVVLPGHIATTTHLLSAHAPLPISAHMPLPAQPHPDPLPAPRRGYATNTNYFVPDRRIKEEEGVTRIYTGRLSEILAEDGLQHNFSTHTIKLTLHPGNSLDPVTVLGDSGLKVVEHDLWLDTAAADTWVFSNLLWQELILLAGSGPQPELEVMRREYEKKNMMVYPDYEPGPLDRAMLKYGVTEENSSSGARLLPRDGGNRIIVLSISVIVKRALCAIALQHWQSPLRVVNFAIGVVDAADDMHIRAPYDGLLGLSRGTTQDFMCFGGYRNPQHTDPLIWRDLDCQPSSAAWDVSLVKILVFDSTNRRLLVDYDNRARSVLVDSASLVIRFVFLSGGREVSVDGQAARFLISSDYVPGDYPAIDVCPSDRLIFGLNFFRTFIVGFKDGLMPRISLAKHPDVEQELISACHGSHNLRVRPQPQADSAQQDRAQGSGLPPSRRAPEPSGGPTHASAPAATAAAAGPSASRELRRPPSPDTEHGIPPPRNPGEHVPSHQRTVVPFPGSQPPPALSQVPVPPPVIPPAPGGHGASSSQRRRTTSKTVIDGVKNWLGKHGKH
ncbi:hypothetical protein AURDEDRAFT_184983 [Auricularia subglabra TFB-10046 SS5]|uniref:Uncharacterized protein n=1 Tax=Auricularia subglabra (strain TFB-10046 / SS5) TaxID=717982 RepID=J0WYY6_AURST|nr:hypothetical protein AURDEDRAFT_184983 [Auricularia subglabra TFB-10046 SS5]